MTPETIEAPQKTELNRNRFSREGRNMPTINIRGKDTYNASTLRDAAHQYGIVSVVSELLHIDVREGFAVARATVTFEDGSSFQALGDASPESVGNERIAPHYVRMAETRAISRAFALGINADANASEEMSHGGGNDAPAQSNGRQSYRRRGNQKQGNFQQSGDDDDEWTDE